MIREYNWKDWMSNPKNKELYTKDMKEGLRQYQIEKQRRDRAATAAAFNLKGYNG